VKRREEAAAAARRQDERRIAALDEARREEEKRKEDERLRLAANPTDEQRAAFVKRVQEVLKRGQCYEGQLTGAADDAQEGLDRLLDTPAKTGGGKPGRIVLAKASVGDFESWLRDAGSLEIACAPKVVPTIHKPKPQATERIARARPQQQADASARPRYARAYSGGGGGGMPLMMGIGH
jgi:hypothetical protein